jgi:nitronate monooxygenase
MMDNHLHCHIGRKIMSGEMELRNRLVILLEAERAGVVVAKKMLAESASEEETGLLETILSGEKDGCRVLGKTILELGFTGSGNIGDFVQKVMALEDKTDRLKLLIKGQEWVVRKLDEVLESELPGQDREALQHVRRDHVINIEKCRQFIG